MAGWRVRGYVQDSDEEEDSQHSTLTGPSLSKGVVHVDDTGAIESGEHNVEPHGRQEKRGGLQVESIQDETLGTNTKGEWSITATPLKQRKKEDAPSSVVGHNTENVIVDSLEDVDELQRDHYKATPVAHAATELPCVAHDLEAELGLSLAPSDQSSVLSSIPSSPLPKDRDVDYGIPSTPRTQKSTPGDQRDDLESSVDGRPNAMASSPRVEDTERPEPLVANQALRSGRRARNLRHRNPIQLHPYALESEQYRQTLKARGVKPLRIAQMEADAARAWEQGSQDVEFYREDDQFADSDAGQPSPYPSSPIHPRSAPSAPSQDNENIYVFGDNELPDMSTLLSHTKLSYVGIGLKRRKTAKTTSRAFRMPQVLDLGRERSKQRDKASLVPTEDEILSDVLASPPHSGSQSPTETDRSALPGFRMPPRLSPATLPTPVTSSEPRRRYSPGRSPDPPSRKYSHRTRRTPDTDDLTDREMSASEEETSIQFQRAQRKIHGVLPASWLKLDLKTQKKKTPGTHNVLPDVLPQRNFTQRGVARMVPASIKSPSTPRLSQEIEVLSDDEAPRSKTEELPQQTRIRHHQHQLLADSNTEGLLMGRKGEAVEDNGVDAMLPSATRAFHSRKSSKRQTRIGDFHSHSQVTTHGIPKTAFSEGAYQRKIVSQSNSIRKRKPEYRPPRLGILDAPLTKEVSRDSVPQFIKVASRTARSRHDKGRHSPSRKFVRLATKDDDNDANKTLQSWHEGTILPLAINQTNGVSSRQPLYPRSTNNCDTSKGSQTERNLKETKPFAAQMTPVRPHVNPKRFRKLQTSLDRLVERRPRHGHDPTQGDALSRIEQAIDKPKNRRQIVSSLQAIKDSRPAMLESAREDEGRKHAQTTFHHDLAKINHFDDDSGLPGVLVRRFLGDDDVRPVNYTTAQADHVLLGQDATEVTAITERAVPRKRKKRRPRRLSIPEAWPRKLNAPVTLDEYPLESVNSLEAQKRDTVVGLGPFGTQYSDTFDVTPLTAGTCFSTNTLLGSGAFSKACKHALTANYERSRGYMLLKFNNRSLRWGPWNDTVSSELGEVFESIGQSAQCAMGQGLEASSVQAWEQVLQLQSSTLDYFSDHLSFLDPIDRVSYVQRCKGLLSTLQAEFIDHHPVSKRTDHNTVTDQDRSIQVSTLTLSLANQVLQMSKHELVPLSLQNEARLLVQKAVNYTLEMSMAKGIESFKTCLSKFRSQRVDYCIQDHFIEAFVVAQHVLTQNPDPKTSVWLTLLKAVPARSSDGVFDITLAEQAWKQLFTLLPFLEIDAQGVVEVGRRFKVPFDDWTLAKRLISPVLETSLSNPYRQPPSFNSYCRAIFGRCLHLINGWGWRRCQSIIGTLFDYFARNGLAHLRREESNGSPAFLECLDKNLTLTTESEDRGFHIVLKIIGSGLRHMRQLNPEKKIRDIVWRLMPNHGRSHPKEEAIRQEHLDALRNHHDLLCTIYWASPPTCRPRLTVIRNLVNLETSHREACHINIRAWFNLVKFQLSTDEPISNLEPFAEWHNHLLEQILQQHSLARTEAEDQVRSAQSVGQYIVSKELLETTISRNQRQVEAILGDALVCLELAINVAQNSQAVSTLLSMTLARVFELFDASRNQVNKPITQALNVLVACASKFPGSRDDNDESQDYGDWSAFDDESAAIPLGDTETPFNTFQDPLRHLLWNCFGADMVPDDALLSKLVEVWVIVAQVLVRNSLKSWTDYLGQFGNDSWSSLRDTQQTRKFSVFYLAILIERDSGIYHDHQAFFLMSWVCSLVERESLLKFQHRLMSALLNIDSESPLLQNLPFSKDAAKGRYQIAASDFSARRLSLISSVLSNMRISLENALFDPTVTGNQLRQEFRDLLKHLMATMKRNYQELGNGSNIRGAYVDFVHRIIEFLQQHTSTICPIDRFFTDNSAFPLPATDPTYVVGQLKNYGLRLQDARTPKQLVVFLQSVSERAAIDSQQPYLVGQLHTAMSNASEDGALSTSSLLSFLVKDIVPAYVEVALDTPCGWMLARPYLQALREVFGELLKDLDGVNPISVDAVASTITAYLSSMRQSLDILMGCVGDSRYRDARILSTLSACYSTISALLPVLDYIIRLSGTTPSAVDTIDFFKSLAEYFSAVLHGDRDADVPRLDHSELTVSISDIRKFATQELRETLNRTWVRHDDQYYVIRGSIRREVVVDIGLYEEQKAQLLVAFEEFFKVYRIMPALRAEDDHILVREGRMPLGGDELYF